MNIVSLDQVEGNLRSGAGIIFGPGLTALGVSLSTIDDETGRSQKFYEVLSKDLAGGASREELLAKMATAFEGKKPVAALNKLAELPWGGAISVTLDSNFERAANRAHSRKPRCKAPVPVLPGRRYERIPDSFPIFRFLGSLTTETCILTESDYLTIRRDWRNLAHEFSDAVKDRVVLTAGLKPIETLLPDLFSEILARRRTSPRAIIILAGEVSSPTIELLEALCKDRCDLLVVEASLSNLVARFTDNEKLGMPLSLPPRSLTGLERLAQHHELAVCVNSQIEPNIPESETQKLLDLVFSPALLEWSPFAHKLDFARTCKHSLLDSLLRNAPMSNLIPCYQVTGSAGSGKSTLLKRIAYDLVLADETVIWIRDGYFHDYSTRIAKLLDDVRRYSKEKNKKRAYIICDDPNVIGIPQFNSLLHRVSASPFRFKLILSSRTIEWPSIQEKINSGLLQFEDALQVPDILTEGEMEGLPKYLVKVQVYPDKFSAESAISAIDKRETTDLLAVLYWLVKPTAKRISESIKSEHLRLGEGQLINDLVIAGLQRDTKFLRKAYEYTAVADKYGAPLPMEVLCSALDIGFGDWAEAISNKEQLWGLIYEEPTPSGDTYAYRTRNSVVSETIVKCINGGTVDRSGEISVLRNLLSACSGGTGLYREFARRLLTRNERFESLSYFQGLELYDIALDAFGNDDRTILHHKGRWVRRGSKNPLEAIEILDKALVAPQENSDERREADEHIRNSKAAAYLDAARKKVITFEDAAPLILKELDYAKSATFFNTSAVHVEARLILDVMKEGFSSESTDVLKLVARAMRNIDETLVILGSSAKSSYGSVSDIKMLEAIQEEIFGEALPVDEMRAAAESIWELRSSQWGFTAAARRLFYDARRKSTGSAFREAYEYVQKAMLTVTENGTEVDVDLLAVSVTIFFDWQLTRAANRGAVNEYISIDWKEISSTAARILQDPYYRENGFYRFILAFSCAQTGDWALANSNINVLRSQRIPYSLKKITRAILLNEDGLKYRLNGKISKTAAASYFTPDEMEVSFTLTPGQDWPSVGELAQAYLLFSYEGIRASQTDPYN